jgi:diguanylate cyclase (GGDEF)-like protein/putative nucleotidyltransferase with HDIG domain
MPPACEACGSPLRAATASDVEDYDPTSAGVVPPSKSPDVTGLFAVFVIWPVVLPLVGMRVGSLVFAGPLVMLIFGATRAAKAGARAQAGRSRVWWLMCAAAGLGSLASAVTVLAPSSGSFAHSGFYLGIAASACLMAAMWWLVRISSRGARLERVVDAALLLLLITALSAYFVAIPGFVHGNPVLTLVFVLDLTAVLFASFAAVIRREPSHRRVGWALVVTTTSVAIGDAFVAIASSGPHISQSATALLWAIAGFGCAYAADEEPRGGAIEEEPQEEMGRNWVLVRVVFPLVVILAFPGIAVPLLASGHLTPWAGGYFLACFVVALCIAFGRQAYLLLDNRLAVARERALRNDAVKRTEQLEALTGLATTMTQTLEEDPIVRRSLTVLHSAARATSSALHTVGEGRLELRAAHGDWYGEHAWADRMEKLPTSPYQLLTRGERQMVRLPLTTRRQTLGTVTLMRPQSDPFVEDELGLLGLLVDELAVAIQHARDYHDRLEQAIRDPLTGVYNRRFFLEAVAKELARTRRYGSTASLVLIDIDDFKDVNDRFGHAAGDEVLCRLAEVATDAVRPMDTFARLGGEEFGLLLPQTTQVDALLVADRIRLAIGQAELVPGRCVTVSAGVATAPEDGVELSELHRRADDALYWCKHHGKDLCAVASEAEEQSEGADESPSLQHLYGIVEMLDAGDLRTRAHSQTVAAYAVAIGKTMGLEATPLMKLRRAALLHDVGKASVPAELLDKRGPLTDREFAIVRGHSAAGAEMLAHAGLRDEAQWVRWHHERVDGKGYPDGLAGPELPLEARILFVADAFEAMTSDRPYRAGTSSEEALAELQRCAGTQFDAEAVDAMVALIRAGELAVLANRDSARV